MVVFLDMQSLRSQIMKRMWKDPDYIQKMKVRSHKPKINDGLNNWQRYRLKDLDAYREKKRVYARTPEERTKRVEYMRTWRANNRERHNELARQSHQRNKHKHVLRNRNYHLTTKYGITSDDYERMFKSQNGVCFLCGRAQSRRLHVDHNHKTRELRKLLCAKCNSMLGIIEEVGIDKIRAYIE